MVRAGPLANPYHQTVAVSQTVESDSRRASSLASADIVEARGVHLNTRAGAGEVEPQRHHRMASVMVDESACGPMPGADEPEP